ncbi:MAG: PilZ domain-containing protein [Thermodesulfobacteriota bacterium]
MDTNRRIYKRVPVSGTADLTFQEGGGSVSMKTIVSNVSLSGLGIYSDRPIADDTDLSIELNFLSSDEVMRHTVVKGHIVYTRKVEPFFFSGIEFTEQIASEKQADLYNYIEQALRWY